MINNTSNPYRIEEKYFINPTTYILLTERLKHLMSHDVHSDYRGMYRIDSLYFDDYQNQSMFDKLAGIHDRFRYRIRSYNLSEKNMRIEKKVRKAEFVKKIQFKINLNTYQHLLSNDIVNLGANGFWNQFAIEQRTKLLKPKVIVTYDREAFTFKGTSIRITFDKNLRLRTGELDIFKNPEKEWLVFKDERMILEIKYTNYLPSILRDALQTQSHQRFAISKYTLCMMELAKFQQ